MRIWHYSPTTGELVGEGVADVDPLAPDGWLVPAYATMTEPPPPPPYTVPVFRAGAWGVDLNHRGETWWTAQGAPVTIDFLGNPAAQGLTSIAPLPPRPPVPAIISDRQFAHEMRARGIITQAEALAFVGQGTLPAVLAAIIAALPTEAARDDAELLVTGATVFERTHPLTGAIGTAFGWTSDDIDDFFRAAAAR